MKMENNLKELFANLLWMYNLLEKLKKIKLNIKALNETSQIYHGRKHREYE